MNTNGEDDFNNSLRDNPPSCLGIQVLESGCTESPLVWAHSGLPTLDASAGRCSGMPGHRSFRVPGLRGLYRTGVQQRHHVDRTKMKFHGAGQTLVLAPDIWKQSGPPSD